MRRLMHPGNRDAGTPAATMGPQRAARQRRLRRRARPPLFVPEAELAKEKQRFATTQIGLRWPGAEPISCCSRAAVRRMH